MSARAYTALEIEEISGLTPRPLFQLRKALEKERERLKYTPDIHVLNQKFYHLVLIYDNMKQGFEDNKFLKNCMFLGEAYTEDTRYLLWKDQKGSESYPVALGNSNQWSSHSIRGELYALPTSQLISLDKEKGNTIKWLRKEIDIILPYTMEHTYRDEKYKFSNLWTIDRHHKLMMVKGFIYEGIPEVWKSDILTNKSFTTCSEGVSSFDKDLFFYEFTKSDLNIRVLDKRKWRDTEVLHSDAPFAISVKEKVVSLLTWRGQQKQE